MQILHVCLQVEVIKEYTATMSSLYGCLNQDMVIMQL